MRGGLILGELFAASITTIDIIIVYALLNIREGKFTLALWTSFLNMLLPFLGFLAGEFSAMFFTGWSSLLSGVLLSLIGLHILLQDDQSPSLKLHPAFIALAVSIDTFTVSVSFGMMHMNKGLFIVASGVLSLIFAYGTLRLKNGISALRGKRLRQFTGVSFIIIGIISYFNGH